eukprot:TRINITY_DN15430_c0_g1_i8.p1 TRINITY_DN15430_c0_g1~~TRINITY_DN15430_c0_g1_i8.p1  ORF type:complete len:249 (-),score=19.55 TRINITY_DN15430_c0_g1_i8:177-923(-)
MTIAVVVDGGSTEVQQPTLLRQLSSGNEEKLSLKSDQEAGERGILHGNWTAWWVLGAVSSALLFWPRNKPIEAAYKRKPFGPWMSVHLAGALVITLVCFMNIFHTPSHGPTYCLVHRWAGRVGMLASPIGAVAGVVTAWWERYEPGYDAMAGGLSALAIMQMYFTISGYRNIRKAIANREDQALFQQHMAAHKADMIWLWVACLGPAWFRIPQVFGAGDDSYLMFLGLLPGLLWTQVTQKAMERKTWW